MSLLITGLVALGSAILAGGGIHIRHTNMREKMRAEYQSKIDSLQRKIAELIEKIRAKDEEILKLINKVNALEGQLHAETQKRDQINSMIDTLLRRQKKLESILHALVLLVTFRIKNWKAEKIEIKRQLENANFQAIEVDGILSHLQQEKEMVVLERNNAQLARDGLASEQNVLVAEIEETMRQMNEGC
jgi:chromosome segregation ATPase